MTTNLDTQPGSSSSNVAISSTDSIPANDERPPPRPTSAESMEIPATEQPPGAEFNFQAFLDQIRSKNAEPVARYLRRSVYARQGLPPRSTHTHSLRLDFSFLTNFSRKSFSANDQVKLVRDFLHVSASGLSTIVVFTPGQFISTRMRHCEVWKHASPQEFDNATEAMEKLVMNRIYD